MNPDFTLIIPTHNRHKYLERILNYFEDCGIKIIVADSTADMFVDHKKFNIDYIHFPEWLYVDKMYSIMQKIDTEFCVICADDDFIIPAAIVKCVDFLRHNLDYAFCQGYTYLFYKVLDRVVYMIMHYTHNNFKEDKAERLITQTDTPFYGVMRTEVLRKTFSFLYEMDIKAVASAGYYVDLTLTSICLLMGKFKRIEVPFGFREYTTQTANNDLYNDLFNKAVFDFHTSFREICLKSIGNDLTNQKKLDKFFSVSFAKRVLWDNRKTGHKRRYIEHIPIFFRKYFWYLFYRYEAAKRGRKTGFVISNRLLNDPAVEKITQFILKYHI